MAPDSRRWYWLGLFKELIADALPENGPAWITIVIGVCVILALGDHIRAPHTPVAKAALDTFGLVLFLGALAMTLAALLRAPSATVLIARGVALFGGWVVVAFFGGMFGDDLAAAAMHSPGSVLMVTIAILTAGSILAFSVNLARSRPRTIPTASAATATGRLLRLSDRDAWLTAWHEAGHVLTQAALPELPERLDAEVRFCLGDGGILGSTSDPFCDIFKLSDNEAEWKMLNLLAGGVAENIGAKARILPSVSDEERWNDIARCYLGTQRHGHFFFSAAGHSENVWNAEQLDALRSRQLVLLDESFRANIDVLDRLATALYDDRRLAREQLLPFLSDVVVPDGFPKPETIARAGGAAPVCVGSDVQK